MSMINVTPSDRGPCENVAPAETVTEALAAVLGGHPDQAVELLPGTYVRASYLVDALAPFIVSALDESRAFVEFDALTIDGRTSTAVAILQVRP